MKLEERISKCANRAIKDKVFPGCVVGVVYLSGEKQVFPFGNFTYSGDSPVVQKDTLYDVASITKAIPTASLALQLIDEGKLRLSDRLIDFIPEFQNSDRENVLIQHLLTYTLDGYGLASATDGADGKSLSEKSSKNILEVLMTHDFIERPGSVFKYTNIPAALLGLVVEKVTGELLDILADEHFFRPLGMSRTTFYPQRFSQTEIVPTECDDWRGLVHGVVHDESAYICKKDGKIMGHAGLFSTATDLLTFGEMLLHKGKYKNRRYFSEERVMAMGQNQIAELGDFTGLGWELNQPRFMGRYADEHTFGKTGFTGTLMVCDVEKGMSYVILSNRTFPQRSQDSTAINAFRAEIGEIILSPLSSK